MILRPRKHDRSTAAITRLADGSASERERAALEAAVARSPQLAAELAEQRQAVTALAALDLQAPPGLHARIRELERKPASRRPRTTRRAAVIALAVLVLVLVSLSRSSGHASVRGVIAIALASASQPPPAVSPRDHALLDVAIDRATFPNWDYRGWRTTGSRLDTLGGQSVETVYYTARGWERVGYSIVGGSALPVKGAKLVLARHGVSYWVISDAGASVLTWRRDGHTCVLASHRAPVSALLALAQAD